MRRFKMAQMGGWLWLATVLAVTSIGVRAQPQPPVGGVSQSDAEWRKEVEARMQQLERENAELRQRVGVVADTQQAVMKEAQSHGILSIEGGQPRLTTPDFFDLNKYASQGDFPGSLLIPGTKTSIQIGGYVQLDTILDSDRTGNDDAFVVSSIPTGESKAGAGNTNFNIRQTRLFLKTQTPTSNWGDLVTYVEVDFMGTDGAEPRIRHAYGQVGDKLQLLAGQTWTHFRTRRYFRQPCISRARPALSQVAARNCGCVKHLTMRGLALSRSKILRVTSLSHPASPVRSPRHTPMWQPM